MLKFFRNDKLFLRWATEINGGAGWQSYHVRFDFGNLHFLQTLPGFIMLPKSTAGGLKHYHVGFDFGVLSLVTFFGRAKKVTNNIYILYHKL